MDHPNLAMFFSPIRHGTLRPNMGPLMSMAMAGQRPGTGLGMSYEQMLSLDKSNVKRGVKARALNRLSRGRARGTTAAQKCGICLGKLGDAPSTARLPCTHDFCEGCARQWLAEHATCPVCRYEFPEADTQIVSTA
eukprot:jgi/Tetstr1/443612/TSEL_031611.t1